MTTVSRQPITDADREYVRGLFPELERISDRELADKVVEIWAEVWKESPWDSIEDAPKNPETVDPARKTVIHTRSVTRQAMALAEIIEEFHGIKADMDIIVAGGLLHDVSKLMEYGSKENGGVGKTRFGELIQHGAYAMHKALAHGLPLELVHLIISHTTQSRVPPKTLETALLYYADYADSDALLWDGGAPLLLNKAFK